MSDRALSIGISLTRDDFDVVVKTDIAARGITAIFGPSGAGKSSLLRAIAGFETPYKGRITLGAATLFDSAAKINMPPHKRGAGYLFQDARLFSHLTVKGNLEYAYRRAPHGPAAAFKHIVDAFDLEGLLLKDIATLSGGEKQRAALARTVLSCPDVLLLDEPLAALDAARKAELMPFIRRLSDEFELPVIFVSHDIKEVGTLADHIICLKEGRVTRSGPALSILPKLQSTPTAAYDFTSWFDARLAQIDTHHHAATWSLSNAHHLVLPLTDRMKTGDVSRLCINASDVSIALTSPQNISIQNKLDVRVKSVISQGNRVLVRLYLPDVDSVLPDLYAFITPRAQAELKLEAEQSVTALVKSVSLVR